MLLKISPSVEPSKARPKAEAGLPDTAAGTERAQRAMVEAAGVGLPESSNSRMISKNRSAQLARYARKPGSRYNTVNRAFQGIRSADVKRRRPRRDRLTTPSWWRSAMISRCSAARDRTRNRSEWSSETRADATSGGYRRKPVTSIDATRTVFPIATASALRSPFWTARECYQSASLWV